MMNLQPKAYITVSEWRGVPTGYSTAQGSWRNIWIQISNTLVSCAQLHVNMKQRACGSGLLKIVNKPIEWTHGVGDAFTHVLTDPDAPAHPLPHLHHPSHFWKCSNNWGGEIFGKKENPLCWCDSAISDKPHVQSTRRTSGFGSKELLTCSVTTCGGTINSINVILLSLIYSVQLYFPPTHHCCYMRSRDYLLTSLFISWFFYSYFSIKACKISNTQRLELVTARVTQRFPEVEYNERVYMCHR